MSNILIGAMAGLFSLAYVNAECPNGCSKQGTCGEDNKCLCWPGYGDADCSVRFCPFGKNIATGTFQECSGRGTCDQKNANCKCDAGFAGEDCGRQSCPNDCSGHGNCNGDVFRSCTCDFGYTGSDCSSRLCPVGDDPLTTETYTDAGKQQQDEVQKVTVTLGGSSNDIAGDFVLSFSDAYGGVWTTRPIALSSDSGKSTDDLTEEAKGLEDILESLPNQALPDVTVSKSAGANSRVNVYTITFNSGANSGDVPALQCHVEGCDENGCQPRYTGVLVSSSATHAFDAAKLVQFYGDIQAQKTLAIDTAANSDTITWAQKSITVANAKFDVTNTIFVGASVTITDGVTSNTITTTVVDVNLAGTALTVADDLTATHAAGDQSTGTVTIAWTNQANTFGLSGIDSTFNLLAGAKVGDSVQISATVSNNRQFKIAAIDTSKRSVSVTGTVYTESQVTGQTVGATLKAQPTETVTCAVEEVLKGTKEAIVCSGRGSCDGSSGLCTCYAGYTGDNCDSQIKEM